MRAVLRRSNGPRHPRLDVRLVALAEDPERVFKKEELLRNVWGFRSLGSKHLSDPTSAGFREPQRSVRGAAKLIFEPKRESSSLAGMP
jgi:hypothetical protein